MSVISEEDLAGHRDSEVIPVVADIVKVIRLERLLTLKY